jgi:hypothetical protein
LALPPLADAALSLRDGSWLLLQAAALPDRLVAVPWAGAEAGERDDDEELEETGAPDSSWPDAAAAELEGLARGAAARFLPGEPLGGDGVFCTPSGSCSSCMRFWILDRANSSISSPLANKSPSSSAFLALS